MSQFYLVGRNHTCLCLSSRPGNHSQSRKSWAVRCLSRVEPCFPWVEAAKYLTRVEPAIKKFIPIFFTCSPSLIYIVSYNNRLLKCIYLTLSASSVPVESIFSLAGLVKNSRRSSVAPHCLNRLCFVHFYANFFHWNNSTAVVYLWFSHSDSDSYIKPLHN